LAPETRAVETYGWRSLLISAIDCIFQAGDKTASLFFYMDGRMDGLAEEGQVFVLYGLSDLSIEVYVAV